MPPHGMVTVRREKQPVHSLKIKERCPSFLEITLQQRPCPYHLSTDYVAILSAAIDGETEVVAGRKMATVFSLVDLLNHKPIDRIKLIVLEEFFNEGGKYADPTEHPEFSDTRLLLELYARANNVRIDYYIQAKVYKGAVKLKR